MHILFCKVYIYDDILLEEHNCVLVSKCFSEPWPFLHCCGNIEGSYFPQCTAIRHLPKSFSFKYYVWIFIQVCINFGVLWKKGSSHIFTQMLSFSITIILKRFLSPLIMFGTLSKDYVLCGSVYFSALYPVPKVYKPDFHPAEFYVNCYTFLFQGQRYNVSQDCWDYSGRFASIWIWVLVFFFF